jgi:hypothetical protein
MTAILPTAPCPNLIFCRVSDEPIRSEILSRTASVIEGFSDNRDYGTSSSRQCTIFEDDVLAGEWIARLHQARAVFGSPGHSCTSNFRRRYSSAPMASLACAAGVKNFRWHLVHEAIAGTLPTYLTTTKLRSAMAGTLSHGSVGVPMARLGYRLTLTLTRTGSVHRQGLR